MRAAELKGIVPVVLNDGLTYKLEFTFNSIVLMEEKYKDITGVFKEIQKVNMKNTRFLLYAGLHEHYEMEEKEVGRLMDLTNVGAYMKAIEKAIVFAFPTEKKSNKPTRELPEKFKEFAAEVDEREKK